jgi:dihydroorotase
MMAAVTPHTARYCSRAVIMPNVPVIETGPEAFEYWRAIRRAAFDTDVRFSPLMAIKLTHRTTAEHIVGAAAYTVIKCAKIYPQGATTASHDGITDVKLLASVFEAMQKVGMVLCIHAEDPDAFVMDREAAYLPNVDWVIRHFPGLRVIVEHITTAEAVAFVEARSVNVAATITAHHLCDTLDDVVGGLLNPHAFCKPIPKRPADRHALLQAAFSGEPGKFFYGGDSAPWLRGAKESACGCAGVFSAPVALPVLVERFAVAAKTSFFGCFDRSPISALDLEKVRSRLTAFTSTNGEKFYGLPPGEGTVTLEDVSWTVPDEYDGVVPFRAGETLPWRIVGNNEDEHAAKADEPG